MMSRAEWKNKARQWAIIGGGALVIFGILYTLLHNTGEKNPEPRAKKTPPTQIAVAPNQADHEKHQALYNDRLIKLEKESREAKSRELKLENEKRRLEERLVALEKSVKTRVPSASSIAEDGWPPSDIIGKTPASRAPARKGFESGTQPPMRYAAGRADTAPSERAPRLTIVNFEPAAKTSEAFGNEKKEASGRSLMYLPSGTFAKARLLNGATAPTRGQGSGNPVPVLLELTDSAVMPNLYRSGIKRCFVTANATGELASERVLVRLDRLSCIDENGGAVDKKLQGYVSGEDGKTGLRARLVTKSGQAIANALFTGTLSDLGKAVSLAAENQTTSITGTVSTSVTNPWRAGIGEGTSHAMDRITDYYLKLASDMFPVLEVDSGREVEIVISNGLSIDRISQ